MCYVVFMNPMGFVILCLLGSFYSYGGKLNIETELTVGQVAQERANQPLSSSDFSSSPVDDQLDVVGKIFGDFCDHVALKKVRQGLAMGGTEHQNIHA